MSLISVNNLQDAIKSGDNLEIISLLELRIKENIATNNEKLLCGIVLLMPPLTDYDASTAIFGEMLNSDQCFEAAVWDAYRWITLLPDENRSFEKILQSVPSSAVASHMLSRMAAMSNDMPLALHENRKSRYLRLFPNNIIQAIKIDPDLNKEQSKELCAVLSDMVISRTTEFDLPVNTPEGMLQRYWDNLILGTRVTGVLWKQYDAGFIKSNMNS